MKNTRGPREGTRAKSRQGDEAAAAKTRSELPVARRNQGSMPREKVKGVFRGAISCIKNCGQFNREGNIFATAADRVVGPRDQSRASNIKS